MSKVYFLALVGATIVPAGALLRGGFDPPGRAASSRATEGNDTGTRQQSFYRHDAWLPSAANAMSISDGKFTDLQNSTHVTPEQMMKATKSFRMADNMDKRTEGTSHASTAPSRNASPKPVKKTGGESMMTDATVTPCDFDMIEFSSGRMKSHSKSHSSGMVVEKEIEEEESPTKRSRTGEEQEVLEMSKKLHEMSVEDEMSKSEEQGTLIENQNSEEVGSSTIVMKHHEIEVDEEEGSSSNNYKVFNSPKSDDKDETLSFHSIESGDFAQHQEEYRKAREAASKYFVGAEVFLTTAVEFGDTSLDGNTIQVALEESRGVVMKVDLSGQTLLPITVRLHLHRLNIEVRVKPDEIEELEAADNVFWVGRNVGFLKGAEHFLYCNGASDLEDFKNLHEETGIVRKRQGGGRLIVEGTSERIKGSHFSIGIAQVSLTRSSQLIIGDEVAAKAPLQITRRNKEGIEEVTTIGAGALWVIKYLDPLVLELWGMPNVRTRVDDSSVLRIVEHGKIKYRPSYNIRHIWGRRGDLQVDRRGRALDRRHRRDPPPIQRPDESAGLQKLKSLGKGNYGEVTLEKWTRERVGHEDIVAMKSMLNQNHNWRDDRERQFRQGEIKKEIEALKMVKDGPGEVEDQKNFVVKMLHEFQNADASMQFILLEALCGGCLSSLYYRKPDFFRKSSIASFYIGSLILGLEALQKCNLVHCDLKPENLVLDTKGWCKIVDLGFCRKYEAGGVPLTQRCGTPLYNSPEVVDGVGYNQMRDWWSVGVILYELMAERHPFFSHDRRETEQKIRDGVEKVDFTMFDRECDTQVVDLIKKLLVKNPIHRLGSVSPQNADFRKSLNMEERDQRNGALAVKRHPWFQKEFIKKRLGTDLKLLQNMSCEPVYVPETDEDHPSNENYHTRFEPKDEEETEQ